jgi:type II secretory pathway pseudopilin PulG
MPINSQSPKYAVAPRIVGEFLVIVVGILIALALDNWNQERKDQVLSQEYLERLIVDIRADVGWADQALEGLRGKSDGLVFLADAADDNSETTADPSGMLQALPKTLMLAFNAPSIRTTTFDDMMSTGRLSLITSIKIRDEVLDYYALGTNSENRLEGRMTGYPQSVFENVPPTVLSWYDITPISLSAPMPTEMKVPTEVATEDMQAVLQWLANDETQRLINAERNYSSQAVQIVEDGRVRALKLIKSIESAVR